MLNELNAGSNSRSIVNDNSLSATERRVNARTECATPQLSHILYQIPSIIGGAIVVDAVEVALVVAAVPDVLVIGVDAVVVGGAVVGSVDVVVGNAVVVDMLPV